MPIRALRFHLSTALLMVMLTGVFLFLNIHGCRQFEGEYYAESGTYDLELHGSFGWPLNYLTGSYARVFGTGTETEFLVRKAQLNGSLGHWRISLLEASNELESYVWKSSGMKLIGNIVIALLIVGAAGIAFEKFTVKKNTTSAPSARPLP